MNRISPLIKKLIQNNPTKKISSHFKKNYGKIAATAGLTTLLLGTHFLHLSDPKNVEYLEVNKPLPLNNVNDKSLSIREQYNFIDKVVKKCAPAVVYILIKDPKRLNPNTEDLSIVSNGSGFIINEDGWILTNAHVVLDKQNSIINVVTNDGRSFVATIEEVDSVKDIALIKIDNNEKFAVLEFGDSNDVTVGEWVVALGSPLSLSNSVSVGIVSSINRSAEELGLRNYSMKYIQTDASITFGNSGGPLVNLDGNVIGINNLRLTSGISFAIPIDYVKQFLQNSKFMKNPMKIEMKRKLYYGITTIPLTNELIEELLRHHRKMPEGLNEGLLVWKVINDSAAERSGLLTGDIITHINQVPVKETSDIYTLSGNENMVRFHVIREGKKKEIVLNVE